MKGGARARPKSLGFRVKNRCGEEERRGRKVREGNEEEVGFTEVGGGRRSKAEEREGSR